MSHSSDNPTIREQLDAVRPGSDDLQEADLRDAARAVAESDEWGELLAAQQVFDREVTGVIQAVDVPEGLKSRLLDSLAAARETDTSVVATVDADVERPIRHSAVRKLAALAAGLLLLASLSWLLMSPGVSQFTLAETRLLLPTAADGTIEISKLAPFDGSFAADLPDAWRRRTEVQSEPKGLDWTGDGRHDGAIYEFRVNHRIHGYLLILPSDRVSDPPSRTRMAAVDIDYQPAPNVAWVNPQSNLVYMCYVDHGDLESLQRALQPHAA